jgi:hypothetical protein
MKYQNTFGFLLLFIFALVPVSSVFADDSSSTPTSNDSSSSASSANTSSFSIPLVANAWNLISIPVQLPDESLPAALGNASSSIVTIYRYAPEISSADGGWDVYQKDHPELSSLTALQPGFGYFFKTNATTSLEGSGVLFTPRETPPFRNLVSGWNLVGVFQPTADQSVDIDQVFSSIGFSGVDYLALWKLDPVTQSFTTPDTVSLGDAFWMLLDTPHTYGPSRF